MEDTDIQCSVCGQKFVFSASEQAYYAQRGFQFPKRCKGCRQARRRGNTSRKLTPPIKQLAEPRKTHAATCAGCEAEVQLAFPAGEREVRCADCFRARHSA
jgi:CxxC-x17-CxxC domain-containing protein